ncbi:PilZ domain-containing protein [Candidatus Methylocalor cossyra]|uniref:PilZ domain-containing protein n=1 Tax=Candidatus Methylocalor cossyra TaxID=3108543 RepID=A0ABM9NHH1_9GAMM
MEYPERRHFIRTPAICKVRYGLVGNGAPHEGRCLNLSGSGILFQGPVPLEPGRAAEIHLASESRIMPPLVAYIEVVRCEPAEEGYAIGGAIKGIKSG